VPQNLARVHVKRYLIGVCQFVLDDLEKLKFQPLNEFAWQGQIVAEPRINDCVDIDRCAGWTPHGGLNQRLAAGPHLANDHPRTVRPRAPILPPVRYPIRSAYRRPSGRLAAARRDAARWSL